MKELTPEIEEVITAELEVAGFEADDRDREKMRAAVRRMLKYWSQQPEVYVEREIAMTERRLVVLRHALDGGHS